MDPEIAFLEAKTGTPLQDEIDARANNRILLDEKLWSQIRRMKSINQELNRGVKRKADDYLGIIDEIFGLFEETHEDCNTDMESFSLQNQDLDHLHSVYKKGDTVKGFDQTENVGLDLEIDYGDLEEFVGEEEDTLIKEFKSHMSNLAADSKAELDEISTRDVGTPVMI